MLRHVRDHAHPLHALRRNRVLAQHLLPRLDFTVQTRLDGIDWPVYLRFIRSFSYILSSRLVEPGTTALMATVIDEFRPRVFWDVGANFGFYSWLFLSRAPFGSALLLEPEPDNLALLHRTIRRAELAQATCLPFAVTDHVGSDRFDRDPISGATGGLASQREPFITRHYGLSAPTMNVETTTLDELARHHPAPQLVKIDVEGAELAVLRGSRLLLEEHHPLIFFEATSENRWQAVRMLGQLGYHVFPSSDPDGGMTTADDFVAVPPAMHDSWAAIRRLWLTRLA